MPASGAGLRAAPDEAALPCGMPASPPNEPRQVPAFGVGDVVGMAWLVVAAIAVLAPALAHGASLGPFDILSRHGLSQQPGTVVHNPQTADLITEMIPWTAQAWTQVHHGHLPLWNPYSALGMPLAFNWQSATFSLPTVLGYLVPLRLAFTVQVWTTIVIAGSGAYVLGRTLRLGVLGAVMAGTVYELSGPLFGWLGWPVASVMSWAGWLFAGALLVVRGRRPARAVAFFAVALALTVYAGQPDALVVLALGLGVFVVVLLALRTAAFGGSGPILRPAVHLVLATAAGAALGAPLLLPGLQVTTAGIRATKGGTPTLPLHDIGSVVFQGFDGLPVAGSHWFGLLSGTSSYLESATYVGVIAVVLAATALAMRHRHPEVVALGAVTAVMIVLMFSPPLVGALGKVRWHRSAIVFAFAVAMLAGVGADTVLHSWRDLRTRRWVGGGFAVAAVVLALVWTLGRGHLPPADAAVRAGSFVWPGVQTAVGLGVTGALVAAGRRRRHPQRPARRRRLALGTGAVAVLLACETAFLVTAGAPLWSSSPSFLTPTPAEVALKQAVGNALVGFGTRSCSVPGDFGIVQDVNVAYGVQEFDVYDPVAPRALFRSWQAATGQPGGLGNPISVFCPAVTSSAAARRFGVGFVLEPAGARGPSGAPFDRRVGDESLYRIPGAAPATVSPVSGGSASSSAGDGTPVTVVHPGPASWKIVVDADTPQTLHLHLAAVPGWYATIDGRPLPLRTLEGAMLQARVPAGHHTVELHYWPRAFTVGIGLALGAALCLAGALVVSRRRSTGAGPRDGEVSTEPLAPHGMVAAVSSVEALPDAGDGVRQPTTDSPDR